MQTSKEKALHAKKEGKKLKTHIDKQHAEGKTSLNFRQSRKMMKHYNKAER